MTIVGKTAGIAEALDYRLSQLTLSPVRRVSWRNLQFTPVVNEIYLKPSFLPVRGDYAAVGSLMRRQVGLYQVSVYGPVDVSAVTQDEIVDLIIEHFAGQVVRRNSLNVRIGSTNGSNSGGVPYASPEIIAEGWRQVPVTVPWWCDLF